MLGRRGPLWHRVIAAFLNILNCGHWHAVEPVVVGKVEAIKMPVLGRDQHELLTARRSNEHGRIGDIPIMPILRHDLEMVFVVSRLGVEHDDRLGINPRARQ
jgi:hypothetical protein